MSGPRPSRKSPRCRPTTKPTHNVSIRVERRCSARAQSLGCALPHEARVAQDPYATIPGSQSAVRTWQFADRRRFRDPLQSGILSVSRRTSAVTGLVLVTLAACGDRARMAGPNADPPPGSRQMLAAVRATADLVAGTLTFEPVAPADGA